MYITVYFGDEPIYLCDQKDAFIDEILHHPESVFMDEVSTPAIKSLIHELVKPEFHAGVLFDPDLEALKKKFFKHFSRITAAGGAVQNAAGEVLLIHRRGKWDLPKGKQDSGESLEACALREVEEETGLRGVELVRPLTVTYHAYDEYGKHFLKDTHWYLMRVQEAQEGVPQAEEDITAVRWVRPDELAEYSNRTYPSVREVLSLL
ncbi:MAG TPA: NUDIX hydrolase [Lacibacter sp.]|nr:NUDIX hydrolase [Lacibacter sp.]HMO90399.1 NUDIX hydrolase [Lacibacter sp.]HMP87543.1 NUDIX hydrolase [Lacibacter sp.]